MSTLLEQSKEIQIIPLEERRRHVIKFALGELEALRHDLLEDLGREHFAMLLGKYEKLEDGSAVAIVECRRFFEEDMDQQSPAFLRLNRESVYSVLKEAMERLDVDTVIDVHTHPFASSDLYFSSTDNADERCFLQYLREEFPDLHYASIVLSQTRYQARHWEMEKGRPVSIPCVLMTQTAEEHIHESGYDRLNLEASDDNLSPEEGRYNRSVLTLGLDVMRQICRDQVITVIGVGGLGSIIAEHLVHMGFPELHLVDPDRVSPSNLNRLVGAFQEDVDAERLKVDCLRDHLLRINPGARIFAHAEDLVAPNAQLEAVVARSNWIIVATDNHASRFRAQDLSLRFFTPLISVGVNITVDQGTIQDMSGEVITARIGDNLCLNCLGRIDINAVAEETHFDPEVRNALVRRGYVQGHDVHEPAVKTLNTMLATLAVDVLVNQYAHHQRHEPIWVYENNEGKAIYPDRESLELRASSCRCHLYA